MAPRTPGAPTTASKRDEPAGWPAATERLLRRLTRRGGSAGSAAENTTRRFGRSAGITAVTVALLALLVATDRGTSPWLAARRSPMVDDVLGPWAIVGEPLFALAAGMVFGGIGLALGLPGLRGLAARAGSRGIVAFVVASVIAMVAEGAFWDISAGVAVAVAIATVFRHEARPVWFVACAAAALTATQALVSGGAAPSGVFAGALLGVGAGLFRARRPPATRQGRADPTTIHALAGIALIVVPLLFLGLGWRHFAEPDEGRYAAIPYEMLVRDDLVTPTLNHLLYFQKPPLLYWCVAGAFRLLGVVEWAARLVTAFSSLGGIACAFALGRRMFGLRAGTIAAVVLGCGLLWPAMGRYLTIDILLSALVFAALTTWWFGHVGRGPRRWMLDVAFWVLVGLGVLAKGPIAVVLVVGTIGLYSLARGEIADALRPRFLVLSVVAVLVAGPWFVLVSQRNPSFNQHFWYEQHVGRFLGTGERGIHAREWWFLLAYLPALFLPWAPFVPGAIATGFSRSLRAPGEHSAAKVFLAAGCVFVTLFFSASTGKLPMYLLPIIPLLAVGLGGWLASIEASTAAGGGARELLWARRGGLVLAALVVAVAAAAVVAGIPAMRAIEARGPGMVLAVVALLVAWGVALAVAASRHGIREIIATTAAGSASFFLAVVVGTATVFPNHAFAPLADHIRPGLDAGADLFAYRGWIQGAVVYTGRRIPMFAQSSEVEWGASQLPDAERPLWFDKSTRVFEVRKRLASDRPVYCVLWSHETAQRLLHRLGPGVREVIWNKRRSIVGNAAACALTPPREGGLLGKRWTDFPE